MNHGPANRASSGCTDSQAHVLHMYHKLGNADFRMAVTLPLWMNMQCVCMRSLGTSAKLEALAWLLGHDQALELPL